ncbi:2-hydroxy-3-oxopropionate reductase, partial [hydrothermal vent metagenome]
MTELAFLGLGTMGFPMAGHLATAGHRVTVWNRTGAVAEKWAGLYAGRRAETAVQAVQTADIVFACLGDDPDVKEVAIPVFAAMKPGAVFVDHTTTSAKLARELGELAIDTGFGFVDAPVSGGQAGAENAQLTIMCGGTITAFETAKPVMQHYAKAIQYMGEAGAGQLTKMVNQICIAGVVQGLAEGLHFAEKSGLDPKLVFE